MIALAQEQQLPQVVVFEDDIELRESFDTLLQEALDELPANWDALWLGGTTVKAVPYSTRIKKLIAGTGGYGIIFRNTMYQPIIEILKKEMYLADISYMKLQPEFNCFRTAQNLVLHKAGYSTIQKRHVDYPELRK